MNHNQSTPKTAVVTGGAHGIGRCIAEEFRKAGVRVFVIDKAGFITGENICIDGGMTRLMVYHGDCGWSYEPPAAGKELSAAAEEERIQSGGVE